MELIQGRRPPLRRGVRYGARTRAITKVGSYDPIQTARPRKLGSYDPIHGGNLTADHGSSAVNANLRPLGSASHTDARLYQQYATPPTVAKMIMVCRVSFAPGTLW